VNCKPGAIENVLNSLQFKMAKYRERKSRKDSQTSPSNHNASPVQISEKKKDLQLEAAGKKNDVVSKAGVQNGGRARTPNAVAKVKMQNNTVDDELLLEKEAQIRELQETVEILELKIAKLEQLVRLKDNKIQKLLQTKA
jgi:hydrocephalus-inducing protein